MFYCFGFYSICISFNFRITFSSDELSQEKEKEDFKDWLVMYSLKWKQANT